MDALFHRAAWNRAAITNKLCLYVRNDRKSAELHSRVLVTFFQQMDLDCQYSLEDHLQPVYYVRHAHMLLIWHTSQ